MSRRTVRSVTPYAAASLDALVKRPASLRDEIAREVEASRAAFPAPGAA